MPILVVATVCRQVAALLTTATKFRFHSYRPDTRIEKLATEIYIFYGYVTWNEKKRKEEFSVETHVGEATSIALLYSHRSTSRGKKITLQLSNVATDEKKIAKFDKR